MSTPTSATSLTNSTNGAIPPTPLTPTTSTLTTAEHLTDVEATKYYVFNETGNIMVSTTAEQSTVIAQSVQNVFNEVSVFFAGMTKAISSTKKPNGNNGNSKASEYYSIYDYSAIKKVIDGSGCFVQLTQESLSYESKSFGASFSIELLASLLALPMTGGASSLEFATSLISTIASQCSNGEFSISSSSSDDNTQVGNITFVCEYLLGMPCISAIVSYASVAEVKQAVKIGPCAKESSTKTAIGLNKDVYLFVTPSFIKEYAGSMDAVITNQEYSQFVGYLQNLLTNEASIVSPIESSAGVVLEPAASFDRSTSYVINGSGFGVSTNKGIVCLGVFNSKESSNQFSVSSWNDSSIEISIPSNMPAIDLSSIYIYGPNGSKLLAETNGSYVMPAAQAAVNSGT